MRDVSYRFLLKKKKILSALCIMWDLFFPYQKSNLCLVKWTCRFLTTGPQGRPSYWRGKVKILHNLLLVLPLYLSLLLAKSGSCRSCSLRKWGLHFTSVTQLCLTLCDPMNCSTPGFPVHHQLPEFTQTHVHWVSDAIQPSHPLSSPSPPAPNPSQHQSLFQWVNSSHEVAKVLEFQL